MLKKLTLLTLLAAVFLWAADFWTAKPYTQWSDKEVQKIMQDSPWAHQSNYEVSAAGGRGGAGGGAPGAAGGAGAGGFGTAEDPSAGGGGRTGGGGGRGGGPQGGAGADAPAVPTTPVLIRWVSATPVKQAMMKRQYGAEVTTSPQAKSILERNEQFYVIYVAISPMMGRGLAQQKDAIAQGAALNIKGKDALRPADVQMNVTAQAAEVYFLFPRTAAIAVDDKEVEFVTRVANLNVKYKFKLKDMVVNNKLEL